MSTASRAQTLGQFIQAKAEQCPDTVVVRFANFSHPDEVVTYSMLMTQGHKLAVALQRQGVSRGMTFGVMMRNHPEFVYALIAASLLGAVLVPIDPRARGEALRRQLVHASCRVLWVADYALGQVTGVLPRLPDACLVQVLQTPEAGTPEDSEADYSTLNAWLEGPEVYLKTPPVDDAGQALEILYTSGTTSDPRGVVLDNRRLLDFRGLGRFIFGYRADDRLYTGLSLAHGNAQAVTLMGALGLGIEAVFTRTFTKSRLWELTRTYGITVFSLLGGMAAALYGEPVRPADRENPVRMVTSAGMPATLWEAFERRFALQILEWYGSAEGGLVYKPVGEGPAGSFGRLSPGQEVRIVDAEGHECPPGMVGELILRPLGGVATVSYWRDTPASQQKVRSGWLWSGDMVHRDAQGYLFFHHRQGDAIRRNGEFINPEAIVRVLTEHPDICDVFVYGIPAQSGAPGEQDVVAAIVPVRREHFEAQKIFAACRFVLAANAVPSYVQVVTEIPKTLSEKPQPRVLRAAFDPAGPNVFTPSLPGR